MNTTDKLDWPWDTFPEDHSTWECCVNQYRDAVEKQELQLHAILTFIDEGVDELLVRRIWERAMRAGKIGENKI